MIIMRNGEKRTEVLHEAYPTNFRIFRPSFMFVQPFGLHLDVVRRKAAARLDSQTLFPCFAFLSGSSLKFVITKNATDLNPQSFSPILHLVHNDLWI